MANQPDHAIALDNKFGYLTLIDVPQLVEANAEQWYNTITLGPHQGYNVPKGTRHRTRAANKTVTLMMSAADMAPTGD